MSKKQKLIDKLISKNITYNEMESLLVSLGFMKSNKGKTSGSSVRFQYGKIRIDLHKPHPRKELLDYQVNKVIKTLMGGGLV